MYAALQIIEFVKHQTLLTLQICRHCIPHCQSVCLQFSILYNVTRSHCHCHGHLIFILATHPEGKWTTNPTMVLQWCKKISKTCWGWNFLDVFTQHTVKNMSTLLQLYWFTFWQTLSMTWHFLKAISEPKYLNCFVNETILPTNFMSWVFMCSMHSIHFPQSGALAEGTPLPTSLSIGSGFFILAANW